VNFMSHFVYTTPQRSLSPLLHTQLLAAPASFPVENVLLLSPLLTT
jgi:hypothetical protein